MFEDWTEAELREHIKALEKAIAQGAKSVSFNDQEIEYSNPRVMRQALADMKSALADKTGTTRRSQTRRIIVRQRTKGWI
jgi:isopropylmalate/homocitrate/citramalate synthase